MHFFTLSNSYFLKLKIMNNDLFYHINLADTIYHDWKIKLES